MASIHRARWLLGGAALFLGSASGHCQPSDLAQADAASAQGSGLGEIVVTARKRAESLQDVPVTVTAVSPVQLQNNNATDLAKIAELAPQVVIGRGVNGTGAVIAIRGISSSSADSGLEQSVVVNLDGVPLSRGRIISAAMFDIRQVEVMQGPQSLYFGKNSPAGVISIETADPKDRFEGWVRGGYEFVANERFAEAALSIPISSTLSARVAGRAAKRDGWIRNNAPPIANPFQPAFPLPGAWSNGKMPGGTDLAGRLTLLWRPDPTFQARLKVMVDRERQNALGGFTEVFCIDAAARPTASGRPMPDADCRKNRVKTESALPQALAVNYPYANDGVPYFLSKFAFASLNLTKELGPITLTSTTGYYNQLAKGAHNSDFSEFTQIFNTERERYELVTQEFRVDSTFDGPLNFMAGAYLEHSQRDWFSAPDVGHRFNRLSNNYTTNEQETDNKNDSLSVFGQVSWKLVDELELAGGARYSRDRKRSVLLNLVNNPDSPAAVGLYPQGVPLRARLKDDDISPEATLVWQATPDQTLYAAYKTGYKAGGVSNSVFLRATATPASITFGSEKARGFEAGYKASLLDRRVRLDVSAYRYNYKGLQVTSFDSALLAYRVGNAARARTTGVTASLAWLATDALRFDGSLGYNKAKYLKFTGAQCYAGQTAALGCIGGSQELSGKALNRAPKVTFSLGGNYEVPLGSWKADVSVDGAYSSSYNVQTDYAPGGFQPSFWRLNAALHLGPQDERIRFSVIGRNLTNSYYMVSSSTHPGVGNPNQYIGTFNRPREVLVAAEYRF